MTGWVTEIELRQKGGSHTLACATALDAAALLMKAGYDVTLKATIPDISTGEVGETQDDE